MKHRMFAVLAAITLAGALAAAEATTEVEKLDAPDIKNFSRIDGTPTFAGSLVGFGGATQPAAMPWLSSEGFKTVINVRLATEEGVDVDGSRTAAEAAGLDYIHLPFDSKKPDPVVVDEILTVVGDKENWPVYIHCGSATRVAALWMIGRVLEDGQEMDAAGKEAEAIAGKPESALAFATDFIISRQE